MGGVETLDSAKLITNLAVDITRCIICCKNKDLGRKKKQLKLSLQVK
jgi:hypothetical protein